MKRIIALVLALTLLLCGCGTAQPTEPTTEATTEPTTEATTEPTTVPTTEPEPVYFNPLNGEILEEPYTGRLFAHTITNTPDALPHVGVMDADIMFEMYVSRGVVRNLALFTDIRKAEAIGATRSTRIIFNQIVDHYDAILSHAGGFDMVLEIAQALGIDHFNVDSLYRYGDPIKQATAYRDKVYRRYPPNDLFGRGEGIYNYAESAGYRMTQPADKDYCLTFVDDATPVNGQIADEITIHFGQKTKTTTMIYDAELGKYVYKQYGKIMKDQITGETEAFNNVIIMEAAVFENYIYQAANFHLGGKGYFACGGKVIPILWECDDEESPFRYLTEDGQQLDINRGNTYIAVIGPTNDVEIVDVPDPEPTEPTVVETTAETVAQTTAATEETVPATTAQSAE